MNNQSQVIKDFYVGYSDRILQKRYNSPFLLRRYVHRQIYAGTLQYIEPGQTVLDAGCGEGILSNLMAQRGATVTGVDISSPNTEAAKAISRRMLIENYPTFCVADAESLPFPDKSFDVVVSSHVLEHLPDFQRGLREIKRVMRRKAIISLPTCLNPCAWSLLGGDLYWKLTRRSIYGLPVGLWRVLWAYMILYKFNSSRVA
ncbi:MAG: class I SAM-dependent methyltransferase [Nitrospirae bacterium]|nr:class I SAM-dependent methyltransferase [Nitrospirota bacterium]